MVYNYILYLERIRHILQNLSLPQAKYIHLSSIFSKTEQHKINTYFDKIQILYIMTMINISSVREREKRLV